MGLFSRKPKVSIDETCQHFYDYYIFGNTEFYNNVFNFITQGDTAQSVDISLFQRELSALRIELFGLVLWNYNLELTKKDDYEKSEKKQLLLIKEVCDEIQFTKKYLEMSKRLDVWEAMGFYNEEIAQAVNERPSVSLSGLLPFVKTEGGEEGQRRFHLMLKEAMRDMFNEPFKRSIADSECLTRIRNRAGSSGDEWGEGFISQGLSRRFAERLGHIEDLNWEGMFRFQALILGMYGGTQNFIETLPFLPETQENLNRLLKAMKKAVGSQRND